MPVFTEVIPIDNAAGASFQLPNTEDVKVMAVRVTVDNSGGTDTRPELALLAPTGAVIATERHSEAIPAGDSGMASWALRLAKKAGGGGSGSASFAFYDHQESVPTATQTLLTWAHVLGPSPLNLAAPTLPSFVAPGLYSITVTVLVFVPVAGAFAAAYLFDNHSATADQSFPLSTAGPSTIPAATMSVTRRYAAGDTLGVNFFHNAGVNKTVDLFANVQQIG